MAPRFFILKDLKTCLGNICNNPYRIRVIFGALFYTYHMQFPVQLSDRQQADDSYFHLKHYLRLKDIIVYKNNLKYRKAA